MAHRQHLTRSELEDLHSVLRRAAERAERNRSLGLIKDEHADRLAEEVKAIDDELKGNG